MFIKLVFTLAVSSFTSHSVLAYQSQSSLEGDGSPIKESSTDQESRNNSNNSWVKDKDLEFDLLQSNYELWVKRIKSNYPSLFQQIEIYELALASKIQQPRLLADYVTLLGWSGRYIQAVSFYQSNLQNQELPTYALNVVALSAREIQNYSLSRELYSQALAQDPNFTNAQLGLAALDIREGQWSIAELSIQKVLEADPEHQEALSLLAYLYNQQQSRAVEKVSTYDKILALDSSEADVARLRTLNLLELGIIDPAERAMKQRPEIYQDDDWLKLASIKNTKAVRRIARDPRAQRNSKFINEALKANSDYLTQLEADSSSEKKVIATAYADRLLVLNKAGLHDQVLQLAQSTQDYQSTMPDYGIVALADSYQAQYQALKSFELLDTAFTNKQVALDNNDALKAGYYAALDSGYIEPAQMYLQHIEANNQQWIYSPDKSRRSSNPDFPSARLMEAMHFAYINQLGKAQSQLESLLNTAPGNNEYRKNYADVLRWRGFVEASNQQIDIIQATDGDYQPAEISRIYNDLADREFQQAREAIDNLNTSETLPVVRLKDDYDIATSPQLYFSTTLANSSGSNFSSKDRNYNFSAYSSQFNDHWRLFAQSQVNHSSFFAQSESVSAFGFGAKYQSKLHTTELELYQVEELNGLEAGLSSSVFFDDYFSFNVEHQTYNKQIPVRAFFSNVSADLSALSLSYRQDERNNYSLGWQGSDFSDGNQRQAYSLSGSHILVHDFEQRLTLSEFLYSETNSADTNRLYFNPNSALSLSLDISYFRMLYKHAPTSLWHGLNFQVGSYQQQGFSSDATWGISYEHQWQLNKRSFLNYSIGYSEQVYDGQIENGPVFNLSYGVIL
ncbi:poly-beta-1,6 N-acetyl-D-glucosamine export porin PgaA [Kangiella koreensis]|uniref:PgaA membrane beta barrel domain-containing protein n=1 Tax=Kangiella koreensis (strain DSM 16069 / JCM 12317 / KCTC 12182 / SW-125) TaxID=523791 RepID=C7RBE9_KANKD|nr:poly-beta-1,6 N-acetyl-D-glucosamine export porin PgaA [Kangiella koreensis]ACV26591.1 hypothetical protein Kkor_1172 [Kangiella koreensis DSM 16069]